MDRSDAESYVEVMERAVRHMQTGDAVAARRLLRRATIMEPGSAEPLLLSSKLPHLTMLADQAERDPEIAGLHAARRPRFYSLDPSYQSLSGHNTNFNLAYLEGAANIGYDPFLYTHRELEVGGVLGDGLPVIPFFPDNPWAPKFNNIQESNQAFLNALARFDIGMLRDDDILWPQTITQSNMFGLLTWLGKVYEQANPTTAIMIWAFEFVGHKQLFDAFIEGMKSLRGKNVCLFVVDVAPDTAAMKEHLADDFPFIDFGFTPMPTRWFDERESLITRPAVDFPNTPLKIGYFGHSINMKKGAHIIPNIVAQTARRFGPLVRFFIQFDLSWREHLYEFAPEVTDNFEKISRLPTVEWHEGNLPASAYADKFVEMDFILLPYTPQYDAFSGVFWESGHFARIPILPSYTPSARAHNGKEMTCLCFDTWDADAICDTIARGIDEYQEYFSAAQTNRRRLREHRTPERVVEAIANAFR